MSIWADCGGASPAVGTFGAARKCILEDMESLAVLGEGC